MQNDFLTIITDSHFSNAIPDRRIDDLYNGQFAKYTDFVEYTNNIDAQPYHIGDFTDYHRPPLNFLNKLNEITLRFKKKPKCVIGNHDIVGYNLNTYKDSALGNFVSSDLIEIAEKETFKHYRVIVFHFDPKHSIDMYKNIDHFSGNTIIFSHNMLVKDPVPYPHILAKDVLDVIPDNTLVVSGHFHAPFDVSYTTRRIINPGSFLRFERMKVNKRRPVVLRIDTRGLEVIKFEVPSAADPEKIFDTKIELPLEVLPEALSLENLKIQLENVELKSKNLLDALTILSSKLQIEDDVLQLALEYIKESEGILSCKK